MKKNIEEKMKENEKKRKKIKTKGNSELSRDERWAGIQLLTKYVDCFATNGGQLGQSTLVQHRIDTGEHPPIHQAPYRTAW
jgi:hypothetical protein